MNIDDNFQILRTDEVDDKTQISRFMRSTYHNIYITYTNGKPNIDVRYFIRRTLIYMYYEQWLTITFQKYNKINFSEFNLILDKLYPYSATYNFVHGIILNMGIPVIDGPDIPDFILKWPDNPNV